MTTIELTAEEMAFAGKIGFYRDYENKQRSNIADYDTKRFNLTSLQAHRLGVMCEVAVGKFLGLDMLKQPPEVWTGFVVSEHYEFNKGPDILNRFEVRRANVRTSPIPLRKKDLEYSAQVVQVYVPYTQTADGISVPTQCELLGWSDSVEDWPKAETPSWSKNGQARVVHNKRPMSDLEVMV
ncbi:hypothetical protein [Rhodococcus wratislaviensis]|uniref:hypothetical protein n=1 Tax=Rhodococcus wratislaviensis TaxID=44752 RepID=UPI0011C06364|nr:hypothetical protein [Rhodococcus wratislaviensis]